MFYTTKLGQNRIKNSLIVKKKCVKVSQESSSEFKDSGIEEREENLDNSSSEIQQDFPSLPSTSGVQQVLQNDLDL